ncbi:unnamed protein product [Camellia sinensis]
MTNCGWNSTLEGVCAGVPLITWPMFAEQFLNEKLVVQILEIGVSVGVEKVGNIFGEDKCKKLVERETVEEVVEKVMDEGIEGEERRKRAKVLGEMAKRVIEEGGSSYLNMKLLIEDVMKQVNHKESMQEHSGSKKKYEDLLHERGLWFKSWMAQLSQGRIEEASNSFMCVLLGSREAQPFLFYNHNAWVERG